MSKSNHLIFGIHAASALLEAHPERVMWLCIQKERQDKKIEQLEKLARQQGITIETQSRQALDTMTGDENHQGIVAVCKKPDSYGEQDLEGLMAGLAGPPLVLILDGVQDPHNLGACFRSADAAGVSAIIVPKDKAVGITPVVTKVACGAVESVPFVQVTNLRRTLEKLKDMGFWIFGAAHDAKQTLYQADFNGPCAIALGAEGTGLRRLTKEHCDGLLNIPMQGSVSSLNVSVATGVFLFEVQRQRLLNSGKA